jgi:hypothetical protein
LVELRLLPQLDLLELEALACRLDRLQERRLLVGGGSAGTLDGRDQEVFLGFEVVVDEAGGDASLTRDVLDRSLAIAGADERVIGAVQNPIAGAVAQ